MKKVKLNVKFKGNEVVCAKSPLSCNQCVDINKCEKIDMYYYPYKDNEIRECFKNDERKR